MNRDIPAAGNTARILGFLLAFTVFFLTVLALDARSDLALQVALGGATWAFVGIAAMTAQRRERVQFLAMIAVATCYEGIGSIIWGLYRYRLGNLPMYVPPGHGLFYLAALRLSSLPILRRHARPVIMAVLVVSGLWAAGGAFLSPHPDLLGLLCWFLLAAFITHGRDPLFFAVSFSLTMLLEYYGTALGTWRWAAIVPHLGIPAANPPSAIGAGYCIIDASTRLATSLILGAASSGKVARMLQQVRELRYVLIRPVTGWVNLYVGSSRANTDPQADRH